MIRKIKPHHTLLVCFADTTLQQTSYLLPPTSYLSLQIPSGGILRDAAFLCTYCSIFCFCLRFFEISMESAFNFAFFML